MMITLFKTDSRGGVKYFCIHDYQQHLFSKHSFMTIRGKGLDSGSEKHYAFETKAEMEFTIKKMVNEKITEGYQVLYCYSRSVKLKTFIKDIGHQKAK
jgi:hypothetical protein